MNACERAAHIPQHSAAMLAPGSNVEMLRGLTLRSILRPVVGGSDGGLGGVLGRWLGWWVGGWMSGMVTGWGEWVRGRVMTS